VVLIDAAGNLARQRPLLVPELLPPLLRLSERAGVAGSSSQAASVAHALKGTFVQLLRSGILAAGAWQESVLSALKAMGHQEAAEQAVRQSERSMKRERAQLDRSALCVRLLGRRQRPNASSSRNSQGPGGCRLRRGRAACCQTGRLGQPRSIRRLCRGSPCDRPRAAHASRVCAGCTCIRRRPCDAQLVCDPAVASCAC